MSQSRNKILKIFSECCQPNVCSAHLPHLLLVCDSQLCNKPSCLLYDECKVSKEWPKSNTSINISHQNMQVSNCIEKDISNLFQTHYQSSACIPWPREFLQLQPGWRHAATAGHPCQKKGGFWLLTLQGVFIGVKTLRTRIIIINVFSGRKAPPVPHKSLRVPHKSLRNREDNCLQSNVSFCWCFALKWI